MALALAVAGCGGSTDTKQTISNAKTIEQLIANLTNVIENGDSAALAAMHTEPSYWVLVDGGTVVETRPLTRSKIQGLFSESWEAETKPKVNIIAQDAKISGNTATLTLVFETDEPDEGTDEQRLDLQLIDRTWYIHRTYLDF